MTRYKSPAWLRPIESKLEKLFPRLWELFEAEDKPNEPFYDPVHLGAVAVLFLVTIGSIYWLLWTLLVYEGGLGVKIRPGLSVLFTSKTLADYGFRGAPYAMGIFEGWIGNLVALLILGVVVAALHRLYMDAARKHKTRPSKR